MKTFLTVFLGLNLLLSALCAVPASSAAMSLSPPTAQNTFVEQDADTQMTRAVPASSTCEDGHCFAHAPDREVSSHAATPQFIGVTDAPAVSYNARSIARDGYRIVAASFPPVRDTHTIVLRQ